MKVYTWNIPEISRFPIYDRYITWDIPYIRYYTDSRWCRTTRVGRRSGGWERGVDRATRTSLRSAEPTNGVHDRSCRPGVSHGWPGSSLTRLVDLAGGRQRAEQRAESERWRGKCTPGKGPDKMGRDADAAKPRAPKAAPEAPAAKLQTGGQ